MAQEAGQGSTNENKREPYFGERKVKMGNINADRRKLRSMISGKSKAKGTK